jgi:hypothetical protein
MRKKTILLTGLLILVALGNAIWFTIARMDPLFRGKPESYWIEHLSFGDDDQVKRWRDFGPEGVHVLIRALDGADRPADRMYRKVHRYLRHKIPSGIMDRLPAPRMDLTRSTRMNVVALLARLSKDAREATSAMSRALRDEDPSVRQIAITFFTAGEDENCLLNQMPSGPKRSLLPDFMAAMEDASPGVRSNAAIALRYYPEEAEVIVPVLLHALRDPAPRIRNRAAEVLRSIDPEALRQAGWADQFPPSTADDSE